MMKLKTNLLLLGIFLSSAGLIKAAEGTAKLSSSNGQMGSCFVASVYYEDRYRVLMTCRGLRSALDPVRNKYVAWVKKGENFKRLGEIVNGKMRASVDKDFEKIIVTAEEDGYANKPNTIVLLSGEMEEMIFEPYSVYGNEKLEEENIVVTPEVEQVAEEDVVEPEVKGSSSVGSAFKVLGKALMTGFLVLLGVVGILSYMSRRKK